MTGFFTLLPRDRHVRHLRAAPPGRLPLPLPLILTAILIASIVIGVAS